MRGTRPSALNALKYDGFTAAEIILPAVEEKIDFEPSAFPRTSALLTEPTRTCSGFKHSVLQCPSKSRKWLKSRVVGWIPPLRYNSAHKRWHRLAS
jgi:hypothetical protein